MSVALVFNEALTSFHEAEFVTLTVVVIVAGAVCLWVGAGRALPFRRVGPGYS